MNVPVEGEVLAGKYRIERVLGRGGMGVVLAARHLQLGQRVAIKLLLENATQDTVSRFIREARAAVRLRSEHAARVLDVGDLPDGAPFMVMEYLEGNDLSHLLRSGGALPVADAVLYVLHTCEAMAEAHANGIIHRDLKPANLFLTRGADGTQTIKVLDFGISKTLNDENDEMQLTKTTALLGSPLYMSPEQLRSAREVTVQSDIWSLGAILYQLLAGEVPFNTRTFSELIMMVNMQPPPAMATLRQGLPPALEAAALRCLEKSPKARFANVGELAFAIAEYGPPEARASAEKTIRTLEAAGIKVDRTTEASGAHTAPPAPIPEPVSAVTQPRSVSLPPTTGTLTGASTRVDTPSRARKPFVMGGFVAGAMLVATAVGLTLRSTSHPQELRAGSSVEAMVPRALEAVPPQAPTASVAAVPTGAAPESSAAVPEVAPQSPASAAAPRPTAGPRPVGRPAASTVAPHGAPSAKPGTLAMPIKQ